VMEEQRRLLIQQRLKEGELTQSAAYDAGQKHYELEATTRAAQDHGYVDARAKQIAEEAKAGGTAAGIERSLDESSGEFFRTLRRLGLDAGTASSIIRGLRGPGDRIYNIRK